MKRSTVVLVSVGAGVGLLALAARRSEPEPEPTDEPEPPDPQERKLPGLIHVPQPEHADPELLTRRGPVLREPPKRGQQDAQHEVLQLTNALRARGTTCGGHRASPVGPLVWNNTLYASALAHAKDMVARQFFDHVNPDGLNPTARIRRAGYAREWTGENIAAGQSTPREVMTAWEKSPGHCANLMRAEFRELGVAYLYAPGSEYTHYWVQNFGG